MTYPGGRSAPLDIGGERGEAIRQALEHQLGISVLEMKPLGLAGVHVPQPYGFVEITPEREYYW